MAPLTQDTALSAASQLVEDSLLSAGQIPATKAFFDRATYTVSYVVHDLASKEAAVIDSVLDYDPASGRTSHASADQIIAYVEEQGLSVKWLLETHAHADHLSAAPYLQEKLGGKIAIGAQISKVQAVFGNLFNAGDDFRRDGSQFDHLFHDGEQFSLGAIGAIALHVPGHTPACMTYIIGNAAYVGDTLFMPDYGTARADFPGGDARALYRSIRRLLSLPRATNIFLCHDYKAPDRDVYVWETTVGEQRDRNVHIHDGIEEDAFVKMRSARDATLDMPTLILPSVQVNMRAGHFPEPENNGVRYLKIPVDAV